MKRFRALSDRFRRNLEVHHQIFVFTATLVNRRTRQRLARLAT